MFSNHTTIEALELTARGSFINGLIKGQKLADNVSVILMQASAFGHDEVLERKTAFWPVTVQATDYDDLLRDVLESVINGLFREDLQITIKRICQMGTAFGFASAKAHEGVRASKAQAYRVGAGLPVKTVGGDS